MKTTDIADIRYMDPEHTTVCLRGTLRGEEIAISFPARPCRHWRLVERWIEEGGGEIQPYAAPAKPGPDDHVEDSPLHTDRVLRAFAEVVAEQLGMTPVELREAVKAKLRRT
ncbi:MAG: hypothetical protein HKM95_07795 [Inquilinus sp.]|nr:hypothetical protein [Inquilinus sp.]